MALLSCYDLNLHSSKGYIKCAKTLALTMPDTWQTGIKGLYEALYPAFGWTAAPFCYPRLGIWVPSSRVFNWKLLCTVKLCTDLNRKRDTQNSQSPQKKTHKVRDSYYWKRQKRPHKVWVMLQDLGNALTMASCSSHSQEVVNTQRPYTFVKGPRMWEVGENVW